MVRSGGQRSGVAQFFPPPQLVEPTDTLTLSPLIPIASGHSRLQLPTTFVKESNNY